MAMESVRAPLDHDSLQHLYVEMLRIRRFEERAIREASIGRVPGTFHPYIGQEAIAVGVCANLARTDYVTSTHRGHGHAIAKGAQLDRMMAELFGKETGYCRGKGGSMHITHLEVGLLGANGIVAGGITVAAGAAWASALRQDGCVTVCFFGESATARGPFHEGLNVAAKWRLPVVYVCENNQYGQYTPSSEMLPTADVVDRAKAYDMPASIVDGNDVVAVFEAAREVINAVRNGAGPYLLECKTYRLLGHALGDSEYYRSKDEVESWRQRDPIDRIRALLDLDEDTKRRLEREIDQEVDAAVQFAEMSPYPTVDQLTEDIFAE